MLQIYIILWLVPMFFFQLFLFVKRDQFLLKAHILHVKTHFSSIFSKKSPKNQNGPLNTSRKTLRQVEKWGFSTSVKNPLCECYLNNLLSQFYYRLEIASMYDVETKSCSIFTFCDTKKRVNLSPI